MPPARFSLLRLAAPAGRAAAAAAGAAGLFTSAHTQHRTGHGRRHEDGYQDIAPVFTEKMQHSVSPSLLDVVTLAGCDDSAKRPPGPLPLWSFRDPPVLALLQPASPRFYIVYHR